MEEVATFFALGHEGSVVDSFAHAIQSCIADLDDGFWLLPVLDPGSKLLRVTPLHLVMVDDS